MDIKNKLSQKELKQVLKYSPDTGIFTWKVKRGTSAIGKAAGYRNERGYVQIVYKGKPRFAHRLAWLYMEGYSPENQVDHINRVRDDNRWCNLRETSHSCNMRNCKVSTNNKTGITGVCYLEKKNKYIAYIYTGGTNTYIGSYDNFIDAVVARYEKEKQNNWGKCLSNSSAYQYLKENGYNECI